MVLVAPSFSQTMPTHIFHCCFFALVTYFSSLAVTKEVNFRQMRVSFLLVLY